MTEVSAVENDDALEVYRTKYIEAMKCIERLHRQMLDVIKAELDQAGVTEINSVQALLLFNIGSSELTAGELRTRGHYVGSNVSYNLKKLVETGYIHHQRSEADRRAVRIRLTEAGFEIERLIGAAFQRHVKDLFRDRAINSDDLAATTSTLRELERFWTDQLRFVAY
jgi:DNA-binding MarR family transcriptional regulator